MLPDGAYVAAHDFFSPGNMGDRTHVFRSTDRITLLAVLARAGGFTERASKKVQVKKRAGDSLGREIVVDYRRVLAGKEPDLELEEGDVVVVKESFF